MKIFSTDQIYEGYRLAMERQQISPEEFMERAGSQIFNWIDIRMQGAQVPIHVFCGIGNNGGDGLVLARHLVINGYNVNTYIINCSDKRSKHFLTNYDRIKNASKTWPTLLDCEEDFPEIHLDDIIVDAVFGVGLNRPVDDWVKGLFIHFKESKAFTLSVDIPSGLSVNKAPEDEQAVVWSGYTLSFASAKLVFFLPETGKYTLQWEILDIGLDEEFLYTTTTEVDLIGKHEVLPMYIPREKFANKDDFGHALVIGGSYGKIGAVTLASKAALSVGAGLVSAYLPKCGYNVLQASFPEAMVFTDIDEDKITNIVLDEDSRVIGIGVGMGTDTKTIEALETFLKKNKKPLVVDADAINILAKKKALLKLLPYQTVLTPNEKELKGLIGGWEDDFDKLKKVKKISKKYGFVIVIKGANTITVFEDKLYVNTTGNPGLSTAGSGDVLTGVITGLISQKYNPITAAIFGVYLHGKSADIAIESFGYQSLIASHIIDYLGETYLDLFKQPEPEETPQEEEASREAQENTQE